MKLSTRTQYGLRMLCQLAADYERGPLQMAEIGEREGISEKYLGQIMLLFKSSGLVQSIRGAQGGYRLSRPADRIGLREIVEVLEGDIFDFGESEAAVPTSAGGQRRDTLDATNEVWARVRGSIVAVLDEYTLEDVLRLGLAKRGYLDYRI